MVTAPPQVSAATACPRLTAVHDDAVTSGGTSNTGPVRSRTVTRALSVALSPPRVTVSVAVFVPRGKPPLAIDWLLFVRVTPGTDQEKAGGPPAALDAD